MSKQQLSLVETAEFNIFQLKDSTRDNELVATVCHILAKEGIFDELPILTEKFLAFIQKVQSTYNTITYHNKTHAADLAQSFYHLCTQGQLREKCGLDSWDIMSYVIAAGCHDVGHMGYNNVYLIEKRDPIAVRYNDVSVLENYHVATTFEILSQDKYNIFQNLSKE